MKDNKWEKRLIDNAKKKVFNLIENTVIIQNNKILNI